MNKCQWDDFKFTIKQFLCGLTKHKYITIKSKYCAPYEQCSKCLKIKASNKR
jgi:hypothetical protein